MTTEKRKPSLSRFPRVGPDGLPALSRHRRYNHAQVMQLIAEDRRKRPMQPLPQSYKVAQADMIVQQDMRDAAGIPRNASHLYALTTLQKMRDVYREYRDRPSLWQRILNRLGI